MSTHGIEQQVDECVAMVDLDIAFSPVLPKLGSTQPIEVERNESGAYSLVWRNALTGDANFEPVEVEALRRMRARYLVTRGEVFRSLNVMPHGDARAAAQAFGIGWAPAPGTPLARALGMRELGAPDEIAAMVERAVRGD